MTRMIEVSEDALDSIKKMAEQDAKDAARYRWLRETWCFSILENLFCIESDRHPNAELDAAIDAAMQTK